MLLGLPWTAWLLIAVAVLPGLLIILRFYFVHRSSGKVADGGEA